MPDGFDCEAAEKKGILDTALPISRQNLDVDFSQKQTSASSEEQEAKFVFVQKYFKLINASVPDHKACVLVHCAMGMSRSATAVTMYLMRKF